MHVAWKPAANTAGIPESDLRPGEHMEDSSTSKVKAQSIVGPK